MKIKMLVTILMLAMSIQLVQASTISVYPTEDTYIDSKYPNNNYVSDWTLKTDRTIYSWDNSETKILLKFNITLPYGATVDSAKLRLWSYINNSPTPRIGTYKYSNNNWNPLTITWNNFPIGTYQYLSDTLVPYANRYYYWDVKPAISNGILTLVVKSTRTTEGYDYSYFWSNNFYDLPKRPMLIINYSSSPSFTILSPNGGENWIRGTAKTIKWNYKGNPGVYIKIDLLKGGIFNRTINSSVRIGSNGNGSYNWSIPLSQTLGNDYKIRITSTSNSMYKDISNNNFTISDMSTIMKSPPHIYHVGLGSANINCDVCHGFPPNTNRPSGRLDSYGVCGNCHETIRKAICGTG